MKILSLKYLLFVIVITSTIIGVSGAYSTFIFPNTTTSLSTVNNPASDTSITATIQEETADEPIRETDPQESTDDTKTPPTSPQPPTPPSSETPIDDVDDVRNDETNRKNDEDNVNYYSFERADLNCDAHINNKDLEFLLGYFNREFLPLIRSPDINNDGVVDQSDLGEGLAAYGDCDGDCPADFNGDQRVDDCDISIIKAYYDLCYNGFQSPDFNNDGVVDQSDLGKLLSGF